MAQTMARIDFWMAGTGNWRPYFSTEDANNLYRKIYSVESTVDELSADELAIINIWENVQFIRKEKTQIITQIPIFTTTDKNIFHPLLSQIAKESHSVLAPSLLELVKLSTYII